MDRSEYGRSYVGKGFELMPDLKISQLPDGGQPTDNDEIPIARTLQNFKLVWSNIRAWLEARFAPVAHVGAGGTEHPTATASEAGFLGVLSNNASDVLDGTGTFRPETPGGVTDHGALNGLGDDDHLQYHTDARGDARYAPVGHVGSGGASHALATTVDAGYAPARSGNVTDFLNGAGAYSVPLSGITDVWKDGVLQVAAATVMDFRDTGDATVTVNDIGGGVARVTVDATAGTGGGGIGAGSPFALNELAVVSSVAGDGEVNTRGILADDVVTAGNNIAQLNIVVGAANGTKTTADSGTSITDVALVEGALVTGEILVGGSTTQDVANSTINIADVMLKVIDDTAPQLGGELQTKGQQISITSTGDTYQAFIGDLVTRPGGYFAFTPDGATFDPNDGGFTVEPGISHAYGISIVEDLKHATAGGQQVYVSTDGVLYGVEPPAAGWSDSAADNANYLRSGTGLNVWQLLTGLQTTAAEAVSSGDRFDVAAAVHTNNTTSRTGTIELGFGINGAQPASAAQSYVIVENFTGYLNFSTTTTTITLAQNDTLDIWARVTSESNTQFSAGLQFDGSVNNHEQFISVPGQGGGANGDMIAPGSMGTGNLYQSSADPKITEDAGFAAAAVVRNDATTGITTGYTVTPSQHAQGTALTPVIADNNWYEVTGSGALTINAPNANQGGISIYIPSTITASLSGYTTEIGTDGGGNRWLEARRIGTNTTAIWVTA